MRLMGSVQAITIKGRSCLTSSSWSGRRTSTGASIVWLTPQLEPIDGDPGPRQIPARAQLVDALRPRPQLVVEARLARVVVARGEHAVLDGARHEHVRDALRLQARDVAVRVGRAA